MTEESVEFPASGIERILFRLCDTWPDKRTTFFFDEIEEQTFYRLLV